MESNKNNKSNNGGDQHQQPLQLRRSARKRKINGLANDGKPAGEDQIQQEEGSSSKMNREEKNDQQDLEIVQLPQVTAQVHVTGEKETADENEEQAEEEAELQILQPMKIQLSKETWFDMLEFVGRYELGQLVPQVGDRRFAGIAQSFLHNYGRFTLNYIRIYGPWHRLIQHALEIPENVKDFRFISLSYLSTPVINLLQKFQQASLFGNVNLDLRLQTSIGGNNESTNTLLKTLSDILPSVDNINSVRGAKILQFVTLYANSEAATKMLKMARFLDIYHDDLYFATYEIAFLNRWLHTPRDDGKPRVLILPLDYSDVDVPSINKIPHFIDGTIKSEFAKAKISACFFIRLFVCDSVEWHDSSMENPETKEKLVVKKVATTKSGPNYARQTMALISRYPLAAGKHWIEANEQEALDWDFDAQNSRIYLVNSITNAIGSEDDIWPNKDPNADGVDGPDDQRGRRANPNLGRGGRGGGERGENGGVRRGLRLRRGPTCFRPGQ